MARRNGSKNENTAMVIGMHYFTFPFGSTNCIRFVGYDLSPQRTLLKFPQTYIKQFGNAI